MNSENSQLQSCLAELRDWVICASDVTEGPNHRVWVNGRAAIASRRSFKEQSSRPGGSGRGLVCINGNGPGGNGKLYL